MVRLYNENKYLPGVRLERRFYGTKELSEMVGVDPRTVIAMFRQLGLETKKGARGSHTIDPDQVERFIAFNRLCNKGFTWKEAAKMVTGWASPANYDIEKFVIEQ